MPHANEMFQPITMLRQNSSEGRGKKKEKESRTGWLISAQDIFYIDYKKSLITSACRHCYAIKTDPMKLIWSKSTPLIHKQNLKTTPSQRTSSDAPFMFQSPASSSALETIRLGHFETIFHKQGKLCPPRGLHLANYSSWCDSLPCQSALRRRATACFPPHHHHQQQQQQQKQKQQSVLDVFRWNVKLHVSLSYHFWRLSDTDKFHDKCTKNK